METMKTIFLLFMAMPLLVFSQQERYSKVKIKYDHSNISSILSLGLALDHVHISKSIIEAELSSSELNLLDQNGIDYVTVVDDLAQYYELGLNNPTLPKSSNFLICNQSFNDTISVPSNFTLGSMGGFFKYSEMISHLDSMASKYPNLITIKREIGSFRTSEFRPIYYVKISDNPNNDESALESQVLYDAVHHAREPMSMSQLIFYMYYLLENYGVNDQVTHIVNNLELFFVPCINPDGYIYNEVQNPNGGGMWRKNRKDNGDGTYGVDLNRNYGYNWGLNNTGSSPVRGSQTYRGDSAFSEPETQAMRYFCENHDFKLTLNYHAYSNLMIFPEEYVEDSVRYLRFAETITNNNKYVIGTSINTLGYSVNGDSDAWMYKERSNKIKQFAFTPEVGKHTDGFWPSQQRIIPLAQENLHANLNMALLASNYLGINETSDYFVSTNDKLEIELDNYGILNPNSATVSILSSSNGVETVGPSVPLLNFTDLGVKNVTIDFKLKDDLLEGALIDFLIQVDFGNVKLHKTIRKLYSTQSPILSDNFNSNSSISNWDRDLWALTDENFYSPPYSITDSPYSNYLSSVDNELMYEKNIDLSNPEVKEAFMNFNARWDVEEGYDYVQVIVNDGKNDYPMCGNYTNIGVGFTGQPEGEPLYDGFQDEWINENIDLNDFLGKTISIRFVIVSDATGTRDGFYLDDFKIFLVKEKENALETKIDLNLEVMPNPTKDRIRINTEGINANLIVFNSIGQKVELQYEYRKNAVFADVSNLQTGIYNVLLTEKNQILGKASFVKE